MQIRIQDVLLHHPLPIGKEASLAFFIIHLKQGDYIKFYLKVIYQDNGVNPLFSEEKSCIFMLPCKPGIFSRRLRRSLRDPRSFQEYQSPLSISTPPIKCTFEAPHQKDFALDGPKETQQAEPLVALFSQ